MTPGERYGERYIDAKLVRVIGPGFCAGLLFDRDTDVCFFTAPILAWCRNQHADKLRQSFKRMGWRATIVRNP
jgi:hypothetical protein